MEYGNKGLVMDIEESGKKSWKIILLWVWVFYPPPYRGCGFVEGEGFGWKPYKGYEKLWMSHNIYYVYWNLMFFFRESPIFIPLLKGYKLILLISIYPLVYHSNSYYLHHSLFNTSYSITIILTSEVEIILIIKNRRIYG